MPRVRLNSQRVKKVLIGLSISATVLIAGACAMFYFIASAFEGVAYYMQHVETEITRVNFHRLDGYYIPQYATEVKGKSYITWQAMETCLRLEVDPSAIDGLMSDWEMPPLEPNKRIHDEGTSCAVFDSDWWQPHLATQFAATHKGPMHQVLVDQSDPKQSIIYLMIHD